MAIYLLSAAIPVFAGPDVIKLAVVRQHAAMISAAYEDSLAGARRLQSAVEKFTAAPDETTLKSAREAWIAARRPYLQSEVAQFCDGPVDAIEGYINSWPIDENYIDYTRDEPQSGIINHPEQFPVINKQVLSSLNEKEGEKSISTGFHAIEYLLWGQDFYDDGPGRRLATDYQEGKAPNAVRRAEYLRTVTALLVDQLTTLAQAWKADSEDNYRAKFIRMSPNEAVAAIIKGTGSLSGAELGGERLLVPYTTKEQENEHSCFSDTTHLDLLYDEIGIRNVLIGCYTREDGSKVEGPGLVQLLNEVDPELAAKLTKQADAAVAAFKAIPPPFDCAIQGRDSDPGRVAVKAALDALDAQTKSIAKATKVLGLHLNL